MSKAKTVVSMHEAKSSLSQLVKRAAAGETIYIGAYGKPEAKLVAAEDPDDPETIRALRERFAGCMAGKIRYAPDWDAPMTEEELAEWYDKPGFPDVPKSPGEPNPT